MDRTFSAPLHVEFGITGQCQLRCSYCSAMPLGQPDAPLDRVLSLLDEMRELGVFSLLLSGGEPTIHRGFLDIAAASARFAENLIVNTNGIRLSRMGFCRDFKDAAPDALVAISLDSPDVDASNVSRGAGGAQAAIAIDNCVAAGLSVCISAVLTETTFASAAGLIDRFAPGVRTFRFFPRVPRNSNDVRLNDHSYLSATTEFYELLSDIALGWPGIDILTPAGNARDWRSQGKRVGVAECVCAQMRLFINSTLEVYPCYYSANAENLIGSCASQSLRDLWNSCTMLAIRERSMQSRLCGAIPGTSTVPVRYINVGSGAGDSRCSSRPLPMAAHTPSST